MTNLTVPGLEGVIAAETELSMVDGEKGELLLRGLPVEILAPAALFEETLFLFLHGCLPDRGELDGLRNDMRVSRALNRETLQLLRAAAADKADTMDALRMAAATLSLGRTFDSDDNYRAAIRVTAAAPTIVAAYHRLRKGLDPIEPNQNLDHAANFLWMLDGREPTPERARALETYLNTVVDHGLNASTFTTRVIVSTGADLISAVVGAIGALKGPLHGGAPGPALDMVFEIGKAENAEAYLRAKLERGERLMGFGHRVYKVRDPRAAVLAQAAELLARSGEAAELFALAGAVEETAIRLLDELKPGRRLRTNVEYYTALLLHGLGFDNSLFTPTFAVARTAGWAAHALEQIRVGRLIRPKARFVGDRRDWVSLEAR